MGKHLLFIYHSGFIHNCSSSICFSPHEGSSASCFLLRRKKLTAPRPERGRSCIEKMHANFGVRIKGSRAKALHFIPSCAHVAVSLRAGSPMDESSSYSSSSESDTSWNEVLYPVLAWVWLCHPYGRSLQATVSLSTTGRPMYSGSTVWFRKEVAPWIPSNAHLSGCDSRKPKTSSRMPLKYGTAS